MTIFLILPDSSEATRNHLQNKNSLRPRNFKNFKFYMNGNKKIKYCF